MKATTKHTIMATKRRISIKNELWDYKEFGKLFNGHVVNEKEEGKATNQPLVFWKSMKM